MDFIVLFQLLLFDLPGVFVDLKGKIEGSDADQDTDDGKYFRAHCG